MAGDASRFNGVKGGRPKGSRSRSTITAEQAKQALIDAYIADKEPINKALMDKAKSGDIQAIKELHDRVYGKAPQDMNIKADVTKRIISIDE